MINNNGFDSAKEKSEAIASAFREVSALIGKRGEQSITLKKDKTIVPGLDFVSDANALVQRASDIEKGIFNMIVLGEFKHGKSTLLNSMLGGKVLPAKATPCTAIITILVYGDSDKVALYESDRDNPKILTWEEFKGEFQLKHEDQETLDQKGYVDRFSNIEYAQIESHNRLCDNGVRLIDSPGLRENAARTKVTTKFLKQSQAIIFVLNATQIISEDERDFIENYFEPGRVNNVFFVVNRINLVEEEEINDIKQFVKSFLENYFIDRRGEFDEQLYNRRVFFVNAKGALDARMNLADDAVLDSSGVPELEQELERYVASPEKITAVFESEVQFLASIISNSSEKITQQNLALQQPLNKLEEQRHHTKGMLQELEENKKEIEKTIMMHGGMIKNKVYNNLIAYIDEMKDSWGVDSQKYIKLDFINLANTVKSIASKKAQQKMFSAIERETKRYIEIKLQQWSETIVPILIEDDIKQMLEELESQVGEFELKLDKIKTIFAGGKPEDVVDIDDKKVQRIIQFVLSFGDVSAMTGALMGKGDWLSFLGRMIQQALALIVIEVVIGFSNPFGWLALVIGEGWLISQQKKYLKRRVIEKMGEEIHASLKKELPKKQNDIYDRIDKQFQEMSTKLTSNLQEQIDETLAEQDKIINQKQDASFSVEQEQSRLDNIENKLVDIFNQVSIVTHGTSFSLEEINQMASKRKTVFI